jgi:hypothetical protein
MKTVSALLSAAALANAVQAYSEGFDLTDHTSQLNFYHQAATDLSAEDVALDDTCVVDQVHMVRGRFHCSCSSSCGSRVAPCLP